MILIINCYVVSVTCQGKKESYIDISLLLVAIEINCHIKVSA